MLFCSVTHPLQDIPNGNKNPQKKHMERDLQIRRLTFVAAPTRCAVGT
jgi:hypothetical protein